MRTEMGLKSLYSVLRAIACADITCDTVIRNL